MTEFPRDDLSIKAWFELCPSCTEDFRKWQCAPNPGAWANPKVQENPQLLAFLASARVTGSSPEEWRKTISSQLLLIRRICTDNKDGTHGDYTPMAPARLEPGGGRPGGVRRPAARLREQPADAHRPRR